MLQFDQLGDGLPAPSDPAASDLRYEIVRQILMRPADSGECRLRDRAHSCRRGRQADDLLPPDFEKPEGQPLRAVKASNVSRSTVDSGERRHDRPPLSTKEASDCGLSTLANFDAIIVDLRRNSGGHDPTMAFIAYYFFNLSEALSEIAQFGNHMPDLAHNGRQLAGLTQLAEGRALIQKSLALRPGDASIEFALTLLLPSAERDAHLRNARAGAKQDGLLAANLVKLQMQ